MTLLGLIFLAFGLPLALNLARIDDRLAAISRPLPWFMKGLLADYPWAHRATGVVFVMVGTVVAIVGLVTGATGL